MGNFTGGEFVIILIVALVVLGPERLPDLARSAGKMIHKLRTMTDGLSDEMKGVMDDPSMQPLKELGELAARPRQKLTEYALEAEAEARAKKEAAAQAAADEADALADAADAAVADAAVADAGAPDAAVAADPAGAPATAPDVAAPEAAAPEAAAPEATAAAPDATNSDPAADR